MRADRRREEEILTDIQSLAPAEGKIGSEEEENLADVSHGLI